MKLVSRGGRFNRLILIAFAVVAIVSGVVVALGVESSGIGVLLLPRVCRFVPKIVLAVESDIRSRHGSHLAAPA